MNRLRDKPDFSNHPYVVKLREEEQREARLKVVGIVIAVILFIPLSVFFGWLFSLLWNAIMPYLFQLPLITWWQGNLILLMISWLRGGLFSKKAGE